MYGKHILCFSSITSTKRTHIQYKLGVRRSDIQDRYRFDTGPFCWIRVSVWEDRSKFDILHSYYCVIVKPHKSHKHIIMYIIMNI